jgi:hypothetical protein
LRRSMDAAQKIPFESTNRLGGPNNLSTVIISPALVLFVFSPAPRLVLSPNYFD